MGVEADLDSFVGGRLEGGKLARYPRTPMSSRMYRRLDNVSKFTNSEEKKMS